MRQSAKITRSRMEPLLIPGNLYESLKLARAASECVATIWSTQDSDKGNRVTCRVPSYDERKAVSRQSFLYVESLLV